MGDLRAADGRAHAHSHPPRTRSDVGRLGAVLALTVAYTVTEVVGGILSGSLALLADAGHMLTDNLALALALLAARLARRPPDAGRTFGYRRAEVLAALANGVALVAICGLIGWEAIDRFRHPSEVAFRLMGLIAAGGLVVNAIGIWILHGGKQTLNVRAAFLHVLGDLLGSVGALLAAAAIGLRGWRWADPAASVLIAVFLAFSAVRLIRGAVHVLMEGVPAGVEFEQVRSALAATAGVGSVHDLHVWTLSDGAPLLTAHLVVDHTVPPAEVLRDASGMLASRFGIAHATLQLEPPDFNILHDFGAAK